MKNKYLNINNIIKKVHNKLNFSMSVFKTYNLLEEAKNNPIFNNEEVKEIDTASNALFKEIEKTHKSSTNDIYTAEYINSAEESNVSFYSNFIKKHSIGVFFGDSGSGKSIILLHFIKEILKNHKNVKVIWINMDMSQADLKRLGFEKLLETYSNFSCVGKSFDPINAQREIMIAAKNQRDNPEITYIVVEDALNFTAMKNFQVFIDRRSLFKNNIALRDAGGISLVIHHKNKMGQFSDTKQIIDKSTYAYEISKSNISDAIIFSTFKSSRIQIENKAFMVKSVDEIIEVDSKLASISKKEHYFIATIKEALKDLIFLSADASLKEDDIKLIDGLLAIKQSLLLSLLRENLSKEGIGKSYAHAFLKKFSKYGFWKEIILKDKHNAIYYQNIQEESVNQDDSLVLHSSNDANCSININNSKEKDDE